MDKHLSDLYRTAMGLLMESKAVTHRQFFTQAEFEASKGIIYSIKSNIDYINAKLNR